MQYSQIPAALTKAFAASGDKNTIPTDANSSTLANGLAAFSSGFPPVTSLPASAGGQNPVREDFNGVLGMLTTIHQWQMTGAARKYESAFSTAIGGYPSFSVLVKSSGSGFWISTADNNTTDPDSVGSANWKDLSAFLTGSFIDKLPTGTVDAMVASITLPTLDASFAGVPGFVRAIGANTSTTPTYSGKTIVKGAGAALVAGDIAGAGHWIELQYDQTLDKWVLQNPATGVSVISGLQSGEVTFFARNTAPTGYMKANGAAVSRSTYADLFTAIGTTYGVGDGATTFNLPDLRGEFIRGWDDSRGIDSGRVFGSAQADDLKSHSHVTVLPDGSIGSPGGAASSISGNATSSYTTSSTGGTETRPRNIALLACIKY